MSGHSLKLYNDIHFLGNDMDNFGKELILDMKGCTPRPFTRTQITDFMEELCDKIDMIREDLYFWDYAGYSEEYDEADEHLKGISAVQFIRTSNVTIHTLDISGDIYLNIFSCKDFDPGLVREFCAEYWKGTIVHWEEVKRI